MYCVVGVLLLIALVVAIWFAVGSRDACYMKVPKTVKVREHVKRSDAFGFQLSKYQNKRDFLYMFYVHVERALILCKCSYRQVMDISGLRS